jgi:hypothetical protein
MDLIAIIREKIESIEDGDHTSGLKAMLVHVQTAIAHLRRGQDTSDETALPMRYVAPTKHLKAASKRHIAFSLRRNLRKRRPIRSRSI